MQGQNPLDQLRPNHLPDPIGLWPVAIGWWVLTGLIIILSTLIVIKLFQFWRKNRYRKQALQQAKQLFCAYDQHQDQRQLAHNCNRLLKTVALHAYPKQDTASLYGKNWRQFLAETGNNPDFLGTQGEALGDHRFNPDWTPDITALQTLTLSWIKKHHV